MRGFDENKWYLGTLVLAAPFIVVCMLVASVAIACCLFVDLFTKHRRLALIGSKLCIMFLCIQARGQVTNVAASCSQVDVQAAINITPAGGYVIVPAGFCSITAMIVVTNSITIINQGSVNW